MKHFLNHNSDRQGAWRSWSWMTWSWTHRWEWIRRRLSWVRATLHRAPGKLDGSGTNCVAFEQKCWPSLRLECKFYLRKQRSRKDKLLLHLLLFSSFIKLVFLQVLLCTITWSNLVTWRSFGPEFNSDRWIEGKTHFFSTFPSPRLAIHCCRTLCIFSFQLGMC